MKKQNKITVSNINAAIVGYVRAGATIPQIVKLSGVSALDVEAVIIENKLSVKPEEEINKVLENHKIDINKAVDSILHTGQLSFSHSINKKGEVITTIH